MSKFDDLLTTEFKELDDEILLAQDAHQNVDDCPRDIRPEYGGPRPCMTCDRFDKMRSHIDAILSPQG